ncbi:helix-turn-helix domain-containing protein [Peribacillus asahii]|uniref:helix-turn-helix domain-containing protein n=1 Tax=Peribacillus asahii TaxID=228899 RepID=UPI00207A6C34|nr:helix-turn-helix domain-containing protein [Peribacillus asahii]USK62470.1 helix-turn-helix domain-containing protein [Peribacillus asahii]
MENEKLLTTKEVAEKLEVKTATILKYVKDGKLTPFNDDPYQIDTTKLFKEVDVVQFQRENKKPGLTTGEAAKELEIHPQTLKSYIKSGELKAQKHLYKGKEMYFISRDDFENFRDMYEESKQEDMKEFFFKKDAYTLALFQLFRNEHTHEYARLMKLNKKGEGSFLTSDGRIIDFTEREATEFLPINMIEDVPYILKKGFAIFEFELREDIMSPVFKVIDLFYRSAGLKNMKLVVKDSIIHVEVRPTKLEIEPQYHQEEIQVMKERIIEGKVTYGPGRVLINSDVQPINITVPLQLKNRLKKDAKEAGMSMDEYVLSIIEEKYSR